MKIAIVKETKTLEKRVAATPETVKKFISLGISVKVEKDAGIKSNILDSEYEESGAKIISDTKELLSNTDVVLKVNSISNNGIGSDNIELYKKNTTLIGFLKPLQDKENIKLIAQKGINAFAVELIPRISRAQSMDALSSQSNLAGYKAVINAVNILSKATPMMMTAAGTIAPAKILIIGAGVAGLQAIATAKRLGAVVSAFDVRSATKEQVESLGAKFIEVEDIASNQNSHEDAGGYAKTMSKEYQIRQREILHKTIKNQNIVITTALIQGKEAPEIITNEMVNDMRQGSIIVDLAAEAGGNCKLTKLDKEVVVNGVTIIGPSNLPSEVAQDASSLYAKNLLNFVSLMIQDGKFNLDFNDDIIKMSCVSYNGKVYDNKD
tara:strand:+ start:1064 stop:2203 length:1140 start_codon:yes stop_codon:yes gene_type:complete